jgi:hypothetical protein
VSECVCVCVWRVEDAVKICAYKRIEETGQVNQGVLVTDMDLVAVRIASGPMCVR